MSGRERLTQTLKAFAAPVASLPDRLLVWLGKVPTTNARIVVTLVVIVGTAIRYWWNGTWEPSGEWLTFLVAMSGVDVAQFHSKRVTHSDHKPNGNGGNGTSGPTGTPTT